MKLPVDDITFWRDRIARANREGSGNFHYSVYLARKDLWEHIVREHKRILEKETTGYRTLDAGCGYGRASEWVDDYTGVDFSPDFITKAKSLYPTKKFMVGDLRKLPFKDHHFDIAFCISIKQMILGNKGDEMWQEMERELTRVAKKILILEYEDPDQYYIV